MTLKRTIRNTLHLLYALYGAIRYRFPSNDLFVIGVTGTSGKSTTVFLLRQLLESAGYTVGSLSTIDFYIAGENKLNDQKMTMLGRGANQRYLREMVNRGCDIAIVETTSEGALQHRHRYINYDTFIFTNLYPEHIESHGSFEHYKKTKLQILRYAAGQKKKYRRTEGSLMQICTAQACLKQPHTIIPKTLIASCNTTDASDVLGTGFDQYYLFGRSDRPSTISPEQLTAAAEVALVNHVAVTAGGIALTFEKRSVVIPMYGEHNAYNVLAACATARSLGVPWHTIFDTIQTFHNVPGRVEFITEAAPLGFQVIVDYAFEPVALEALYEIVHLLRPKRVIHVCGSTGGGRDTSRRTPIGRLVGTEADIMIVTNEDPYEEDPQAIIDAVAAGAIAVGKQEGKTLFKILDRKEAIHKAITLAKAGDLILVTGKGSEQGMCVAGGKMIPWDDREIAREGIRNTRHETHTTSQ